MQPVGYRVDYRPGDPCFMKPQDWAAEVQAGYGGGAVWPLFTEPQPGCPTEVEVYLGWCWVRPQNVSAVRSLDGFTPLYLGPQIQEAAIAEEVAFLFPSLVEPKPGKWPDAKAVIAKSQGEGTS